MGKTQKINKATLRTMIAESVRKTINEVLKESEDFVPHGYRADSNFGGYEMQISDTGEAARVRTNYGDRPSKPSRWLKIYFNNDGVAYVNHNGRRMRLDQFMRY